MDRDCNGIRLVVVAPKHGLTVLSFVVSLLDGTTGEIAGDGPRIVAMNSVGRKIDVRQFTSLKKAKQALPSMQSELDRLGVDAWCEAHDVPLDFKTWGQKSDR